MLSTCLVLLFSTVNAGSSADSQLLTDESSPRIFPGSFFPMPSMTGLFSGLGEAGKVAAVMARDASDAWKAVADRRMGEPADVFSGYDSVGAFGPMVGGLMRMMGFDERQLGMLALNMVMYVGELFANTILGLEDDIDNEIPQYRSLAQDGGVFPIFKMAVERSSARATEIKNSLLDPSLTSKMISTLQKKTGKTTSCVQLFLCKMTPLVNGLQQSTNETLSSMYGKTLNYSSRLWLDLVVERTPEKSKFTENSSDCEEQFPTCPLFSFSNIYNTFTDNNLS